MVDGIGDEFQKETRYTRNQAGSYLDWSNKPDIYKKYSASKKIPLPKKLHDASMSIIETLKNRKSTRSFLDYPITLLDLSFLLWTSTGIQRIENNYSFRTAPSAGALYPIETYILANNIQDLSKGLYHYNIEEHCLEELQLGVFGENLARAALNQKMVAVAPAVFIWTALFERTKWKYKQRAYRYIYLDAGHIAENLALAATGIGLGSCQIGAFFDEEVNALLNIDGTRESVLYLSIIGKPDEK